MEVDSRAIDEILVGARQHSERNDDFRLFIDRLVIPGMVLQLEHGNNQSWCIGPGLCLIPASRTNAKGHQKVADSVLIRQFGVLKYSSDADTPSDAQKPKQIKARRAEPALGASKKNRPDLNTGDVVYAVITQADRAYLCISTSNTGCEKHNIPLEDDIGTAICIDGLGVQDLDVELSCVDEAGRASGMGILGRHEPGTVGNAGGMNGGVMLHCTPELVRRLANSEQFPLLALLARTFPFEVCLGANGRIWLTARSPRETMLLANTISLADHIPSEQCCTLARNLVA
ncbi:unnamed protein product [Echinostoma caproni]|uniref:KH_dom_type_1 domain-containing protein n=1 Tax=Echinostoma caproni TaxID=27848 RepID=A0A183AYN1_9TREM|nr:unnamed protein product [Echinostoma caproni]